jgi:hypothetical protein
MELIYNSNANTMQACQNNAPSKVKLMIHHRLPGVELVSPMHVSDGSTCYLLPDHKVDTDSTAQIGFDIDLTQGESVGALLYKLQKKSTDQSDEDITSSEETMCTQLVMIWNVSSFKDFYIYSRVIEQDKDRARDRDRLMKLAKQYSLFGTRHSLIEETWQTHDGIVFMTSLNIACETECYKLEMTISKINRIYADTQKPWHIDLDR